MAGDLQAHAYLRQLKDLTESELRRIVEGSSCSTGCGGSLLVLALSFVVFIVLPSELPYLLFMPVVYSCPWTYVCLLALVVMAILAFRWMYYRGRAAQERYQRQDSLGKSDTGWSLADWSRQSFSSWRRLSSGVRFDSGQQSESSLLQSIPSGRTISRGLAMAVLRRPSSMS